MRSVISEIKKSFYAPLFLFSCLGVAFICLSSELHLSIGQKSYTILELLSVRKEVMLNDIYLNRSNIWVNGIGAWTQLFLPFLLSTGYIFAISSEKQSGFCHMLLVRETDFRYAVSKLAACLISGGVIMLIGYLLFGLLVYVKFPSVYEYPVDEWKMYMELNPHFRESGFFLMRCGRVFLYGMCINAFAYLVSVFFCDKYILISLPLMLKYIWAQIVVKKEVNALASGDEKMLNLCSKLKFETILNVGQFTKTILVLAGLLYLAGFFLTLYLLKKKGDGVGFE